MKYRVPITPHVAEREGGLSEEWAWHFLMEARLWARRSKDPSVKCGAIVVDVDEKRIIGTGYNGFAPGVKDSEHRLQDREAKHNSVIHAEDNALDDASATGHVKFRNNTAIFIWPEPPCGPCAAHIIRARINWVYYLPPSNYYIDRYHKSVDRGSWDMVDAGIQLVRFPGAEVVLRQMQQILDHLPRRREVDPNGAIEDE